MFKHLMGRSEKFLGAHTPESPSPRVCGWVCLLLLVPSISTLAGRGRGRQASKQTRRMWSVS
jgi:hypothetical protein